MFKFKEWRSSEIKIQVPLCLLPVDYPSDLPESRKIRQIPCQDTEKLLSNRAIRNLHDVFHFSVSS